ncbi:MAG: hypothetical protein ACKO1Y_01520 [Actinomycetota bacterium]
MTTSGAEVRRVVGVYDADGTWWGEVAYFVGARIGRAHCSLCDITHGPLREKAEWRECRDALPVPVECFHRDDQPAAVRAAAAGTVPVVVAELTVGDPVVLLGPEELEGCAGSVTAFSERLTAALARLGAGPG